ncbi:MAG: DNA helicase UvrBC [Planctomycetaceae bacterium]|nr:DNA helicase UvrBC [Planctomycetaceae bacterium]MBQ2820173.1 UvrB/UvrC motif-containing protein [Thermoguttaceae bacterium]
MKCQKCDKKAVLHLSDLTGGKPVEIHLCAEHAQEYLSQNQGGAQEQVNMASALATHLAQQMAFTKASNEFSKTDQETCPMCGITFFEFRTSSKFGCPNDYEVFSRQLLPMLMNIHGEERHTGKAPKHSSEETSQKLAELIHMRQEMAEAISNENYEKASVLRDQIKQRESEAGIA